MKLLDFWKTPALDKELETVLNLMLKPVAMRQEFSLDLKGRLLTNFPLAEKQGNVFQSFALAAASIFSIFMLIFTGIRAIVFLFSMFGLLRQAGGELQHKRTAV